MIDCRVLGPVELLVGDAPAPPELVWRKHLALIVYLACSPKRTRTREHLVGLFWGDKPESAARHSLNEALRLVRRHAGEGAIETMGDGVRLGEHAVRLDTDRFEDRHAASDWGGAAELVAGEFMEGFFVPGASELEDWLHAERRAWRQKSVDALVRFGEERLDGGDSQTALEAAHRALALDPASDSSVSLAMRGLALHGDRGAALELYDAFAARLEEEFGMDPDEATRALAERVRRERSFRVPRAMLERQGGGGESRRAPLVGRELQLQDLGAAWTECRDRRRSALALLQGDPGTGKTRLLEEVATRARLDGGAVISVRAVEADREGALSAVIALARGGLAEAAGIEDASAAALAAFAAEWPEWEQRFGERLRGVEPMSPARALVAMLEAVTAKVPVLLYIDDAHWADRDSLLALGSLLRDLGSAPLLILLALAPHPPRVEIDELRARIGRDLPGASVSLPPLSSSALRTLARWALPGYTAVQLDRLARRLATDSAGLPLLAVELLHAVALGLDLDSTGGAWPAASRTLDQTLPGELPDAIVAAIRVGFRRLGADAREALVALAVLGDRQNGQALAAATGLEPEVLAAALDELEWQRWIVGEARGYSVVARIVREVVSRDMVTSGQRQRILEATKAGS